MATPNQITEAENAMHPPAAPVDPFAVDFFGGAPPLSDEEEMFSAKTARHRRHGRPAKKSDWHKNLPRITNAEAEFSNLLASLPDKLTETAAKTVAGTLARYTFQPAENAGCSLISVSEINLKQALQKFNEAGKIFLTIGSRTEDTTAIAALNVDFASALIDSALDGQSAPSGYRRELSPVETTVVEFLAANVLREINAFFDESMLYLQNVQSSPAGSFDDFERGAEVVLSLKTGDLHGVVNLFVPQKFLRFLDKSQNPLFIKKADRKNLCDFEKIARELDLRLQIGTTFLDADSLLYLEPDDIVLIEQPQISLQNDNFGALQIFVGHSRNYRFRGLAESNGLNGGLNFKIEEILSEEARRKFTPAKFKMDEKENELAEENALENASPEAENSDEEVLDEQISPALENIQVALRVEIAGSKISLRELQNIRAGQIIALGCSPNDPVRLVTDNNEEPVATGELVEIEGQLGVRLTKVFI